MCRRPVQPQQQVQSAMRRGLLIVLISSLQLAQPQSSPSLKASERRRVVLSDEEDPDLIPLPPVSVNLTTETDLESGSHDKRPTANQETSRRLFYKLTFQRKRPRVFQTVIFYPNTANHDAPNVEEDLENHPNWRLLNDRKCGLSKSAILDRIVGGNLAQLGQHPWLARIGYYSNVFTVLCIYSVGVRLGELDTSTDPDCLDFVCAPPAIDVDADTIVVHQDYDNPRFANDIALVKLTRSVTFNGWVAPVCVPYGDLLKKSYELQRTEVAGWGIHDIAQQKTSQELRTVRLPVVSNTLCHFVYRHQATITNKQMCAGGEVGYDTCSGDSGGPLLKVEAYDGLPRYYVLGIVSFGSRRCGMTPAPGVYTSVSQYMDWILENLTTD